MMFVTSIFNTSVGFHNVDALGVILKWCSGSALTGVELVNHASRSVSDLYLLSDFAGQLLLPIPGLMGEFTR